MKKNLFFILFSLIAILMLVGCEAELTPITTESAQITTEPTPITTEPEPVCEHSFKEEIITEATTTESGFRELTCRLCGEIKTDSFELIDYLKESAEYRLESLHRSTQNNLLNPSSYTVNSDSFEIYHDKIYDRYFLVIYIDYSAQNRMGGYSRESDRIWYGWWGSGWIEERIRDLSSSSDEYYEIACELMWGTFGRRNGVTRIY